MLHTRIPALLLLSSWMAMAAPASAQIELPEDIQLELEVVDVDDPAPLDDPPQEPVAQAEDATGARVMGELGASLATIVGGGLVGGLLGAALARPCSSSDPDELDFCLSPMLEILVGIMVGGIVGVALTPFAVTAAGDAIGGEGQLEGAWLGWLVGVGSAALTVGIGTLALATLDSPTGSNLLIVSASLAGAMVLIGPLVGYELSHGRERRRSPITVAPTLGYDGTSGTVGATGTF